MLSANHRFHGLHSLDKAYRNGTTVRGGAIALRYWQNPRRSRYRAAVVVSKKVHKSAVGRNRIRRRLYEAIRLGATGVSGGYDLVFTVYSADVITMPSDQLHSAVAKLLQPISR